MSRVFQRCANARGANRSGGLSNIEVPQDPNVPPKDCTEWKTLDCPKEIEQALLERNRKHFGQAQGTPFTVPPLSQEINFEASTATSELILNGSYTHEDLDNMTQLLIDHLQRVSAPAVDSNITAEEFKSKIMNWQEKTSTSHQACTWDTTKHIIRLTRSHQTLQNTMNSKTIDSKFSMPICNC